MAEESQDKSVEEGTVRPKRELKITPLNPDSVKTQPIRTMPELANSKIDSEDDQDPLAEDPEVKQSTAVGFKPDFVDNGQYHIKIKNDVGRAFTSSKKTNKLSISMIVSVILLLVLVVAIALFMFVFNETRSDINDTITNLFI